MLELLTPSLSQSQHHSSRRSRDSDIMSVPSGLATALALLSSMESREPLAISSGPTWEVLVVTDIDFQVVIVNPGGTGSFRRVISLSPAPLPPRSILFLKSASSNA